MTQSKVEDRLSESETIINREVAASLRYLCEAANITRSRFEQAFTNISYATGATTSVKTIPTTGPSPCSRRSVGTLACR